MGDPPPSPAPAPRRFPRDFAHAAVLFALAAIVFTWPLVLHLRTHMVGWAYDNSLFVWTLHWFGRALFALHTNPFHTTAIFHPEGCSLWLHTNALWKVLLALPLWPLVGAVTLYNLMVLLSLWLSALAAWALCRAVTRSRAAALLGGFVYGFGPWQTFHMQGHLNLVSMEWLPLVALACLRLSRSPTGGRALWLGVALTGAALSDWQFAPMALLFVACAALWTLARRRARWQHLRALTAALALFAVLIGPLALPTARAIRSGRHEITFPPEAVRAMSNALISPLVPSERHILFNPFTGLAWPNLPQRLNDRLHGEFAGFRGERDAALGFTLLALMALACLRHWRLAKFWLGLFLLFLLLSMGPDLRPLGAWRPGGLALPALPGPYRLVEQIPLVQMVRFPSRFFAFGVVAASVLGAIGFRALLRAAHRRWVPLVAVPALALAEYWVAPVTLDAVPSNPFCQRIASVPGGAVLDLPWVSGYAPYMHMQIHHGRDLLFGHIARTPVDLIRDREETHRIDARLAGGPSEAWYPLFERFAGALRHARCEFVVFHRKPPGLNLALWEEFLALGWWDETSQGPPPPVRFERWYDGPADQPEDQRITVFRVLFRD